MLITQEPFDRDNRGLAVSKNTELPNSLRKIVSTCLLEYTYTKTDRVGTHDIRICICVPIQNLSSAYQHLEPGTCNIEKPNICVLIYH